MLIRENVVLLTSASELQRKEFCEVVRNVCTVVRLIRQFSRAREVF